MKFVNPSDSMAMKRLLESARNARPTYSDRGATLAGGRPKGFHHGRYTSDLGHGHGTFARAVEGLRAWDAHRLPGVRVFPEGQEIQTGATVVVTVGTPILALAAPCRIVGVIDEETRWGFAYGTLPGHPEQGEEAFVVSMSIDETVQFEVVAFSRPGELLVRLSGPIGRGLQHAGSNGYLRALGRSVDRGKRNGETDSGV
jgi:uncharacterized protein (UPF0548 family)